jgi:cytochrome b subunit of formate dehydrogenase
MKMEEGNVKKVWLEERSERWENEVSKNEKNK